MLNRLDVFRLDRDHLVEELFQCLEHITAKSGYHAEGLGEAIENDLQKHVQKEYARCVIQVSTALSSAYITVTFSCHSRL